MRIMVSIDIPDCDVRPFARFLEPLKADELEHIDPRKRTSDRAVRRILRDEMTTVCPERLDDIRFGESR